jgi:hypothetical protein
MTASFVDRLISKKGHLIHKLRAIDINGKNAYYFVLIEQSKELAFNRALESGADKLNFEDYGKVIASCYGDEPNERVKELLRQKYSFDI